VLHAAEKNNAAATSSASLEKEFGAPPRSFAPGVYYYITDGRVSKEGITADFEALSRFGISEIHVANNVINHNTGTTLDYGSERWNQMYEHMIHEAGRLGLKLVPFISEGWSSSGGPWITPENSMQTLVWSTTTVSGGKTVVVNLPQPGTQLGYFKDTAVVAILSPDGKPMDFRAMEPTITSSGVSETDLAFDDSVFSFAVAAPKSKKGDSAWIQVEFPEPTTIHGITLKGEIPANGFVEISEDGTNFRRVTSFLGRKAHDQEYLKLEEPVTARFWRIGFDAPFSVPLAINDLILHNRAVVESYPEKSGRVTLKYSVYARREDLHWKPAQGPVPLLQNCINLSDRMDATGCLRWQAPAGEWTVLRFGHTTTAAVNHPAAKAGTGLEGDKFTTAGIQANVDHYLSRLLAMDDKMSSAAIVGFQQDSWEVGPQNWTSGLPAEFEKRRGYSMLPYLPVMAGHVIESQKVSEGFLWDLRRTFAELTNENHWQYLRSVLADQGLFYEAQTHMLCHNFDMLSAFGQVDVPMTEFWVNRPVHYRLAKIASSAGHIYGRTIVSAEAFTSKNDEARGWTSHPGSLKLLGDLMFSRGINKFVLSLYVSQPYLNLYPGMTLSRFGTDFNRNTTWFEQGREWVDYLTRSQLMLRSGRFIADLLILTQENSPLEPWQPDRRAFQGYDYDLGNNDVLLQATVENGEVVLPSGMRYRLLVLPESRMMTVARLEKLQWLIDRGANVLALSRPEFTPSLAEQRALTEGEFGQKVSLLWDSVGAAGEVSGRLFQNKSISEALAALGRLPDLEFPAGKPIEWIHRRLADGDLYFLSNQSDEPRHLDVVFRNQSGSPELWNPATGEMHPAALWQRTDDGRCRLPLEFEARDSVFVVFKASSQVADGHVAAATFNGDALGNRWTSQAVPVWLRQGSRGLELLATEPGLLTLVRDDGRKESIEVREQNGSLDLSSGWTLQFPPQPPYGSGVPPRQVLSELTSWSDHPEEAVRYFSGSADYSKSFVMTAEQLGGNQRYFLDLGRVEVLAGVFVNGTSAGIFWKPPFVLDVTDKLRSGENKLVVKVTNLWPNRLIGDEHLPADAQYNSSGIATELPAWLVNGEEGPPKGGRVTFSTFKHWQKEDALLPSGLLGPVTLRACEVKTLQ